MKNRIINEIFKDGLKYVVCEIENNELNSIIVKKRKWFFFWKMIDIIVYLKDKVSAVEAISRNHKDCLELAGR